ncbi:MAG: O-antigen ligase family protein [Calditrichaeota bacterium]|nr:O-antigen ligase family protein [Calditrichota bacterium]
MISVAKNKSMIHNYYLIIGLVVTGLIASIASWAIWSLELKWAVFSFIGLLFPFILAMVRDTRRFIMGLMIFAVPLNADYYFVLHPSPGGANGINIGLTDILLVILIIQTFLYASNSKQTGTIKFFPAITLPTLAIIAISIFSLLQAKDVQWGLFDIISFTKAFLFFFFLANNIKNKDDLTLVLKAFFLGLVIQAVIVGLQYYKGTNLGLLGLGEPSQILEFEMKAADVARPGGTIGHCNHLARYIGFILPISIILALVSVSSKSMSRLAAFVSMAGILALIYTLTRSSWIGLLLSIAVMIPFMFKYRLMSLRTIGKFALGSMVLLILLSAYGNVIWDRLISNDMGSAKTRLTTAQVALHVIADHPILGVGINNYGSILEKYWSSKDSFTRIAAVHNTYLLYAAELGLVGFGAYLWLLTAFFVRIKKAMKSRSKYLSAIAVGVMGSFAGYLLTALSDKSYKESFSLLIVFWSLMAIIEAIILINERQEQVAVELLTSKKWMKTLKNFDIRKNFPIAEFYN